MKFKPNRHTLVWGTEDWLVSAHASSPCAVADGVHKGESFLDINPNFPILIKAIDAKTRLSVQVHPNDGNAHLTGGEPKTEMWCVLEPGPIYAGLKPGTTPEEVEMAIASGEFEKILVRHDTKRFESYFIPGGLVHAIGDGVKLYEVQQSSNTTYRLYDWGRMGADGKPRELHIAESLKTIDFSLMPPTPVKDVKCDFFDFSQHDFTEATEIVAATDEYLAIYETASGESTLLYPGEKTTILPGHAFLTRISAIAH